MIEEVTAGLDWITLTLPVGAVSDQVWLNTGLSCLDTVVQEGYELQYRDLLGYSGVGAGGSFVGTRHDTHMMQFSGRHADAFFADIYRFDAHISRLDVQVTVKFKKMPKGVAKEAYRDAIAENETIPVGRRRKIWVIVGSDGGDTCYVGSSSSDARGRIYNKEVQSEDPKYSRTWRFEVMLRNGQATSLSRSIQARLTARTQFCSDWVAIWFEKRGVKAPWTFDETFVPIPPLRTLPTDTERKLNWLKHQVSPTVKYLLTQCEKDTILTLLGLS
jgi:Replication initiation factor